MHEGDGRDAVLRIVAAGQEMIPEAYGQGHVEARARHVDPARDLAARPTGRVAQQEAGPLGRTDRGVGDERGRGLTHHDLTGVGRRFHRHGLGGRRTRDHELAMGPADEEQQKATAVYADRHAQPYDATRRLDPPDRTQPGPHARRRPTTAGGMVVTDEQDEQRVAAELEEHPAFGVRNGQKLRETRADDVGELLRTDPAPLGQLLRQAREPRDVDEHRRRVELTPPASGLVGEPLVDQARHERSEDLELPVCHAR